MRHDYFCGIHIGEKNYPDLDDQTKIAYLGLYNVKLKLFHNGYFHIKDSQFGCSFDVFKTTYQFVMSISRKDFIKLSHLSLDQVREIYARRFLIEHGMEEHVI